MDLPFDLPDGSALIELSPDVFPRLDGHELVASWHVGGPDYMLPPDLSVAGLLGDVDAVTVTVHQRYETGRLVPNTYEIGVWRRVADGG
ncbi:MAG TPA: hypothetical protein VG276_27920 [Actinomycetes bacterium]|nr:hypothetical protein [Actinomycetes bacterium]